MIKYYDYVAPDYKVRFGTGGDWFKFENKDYIIAGDLKDDDWKTKVYDNRSGYNYGLNNLELDDVPYETLVLFREALAIKGLEYVLDKEVTLLEGK